MRALSRFVFRKRRPLPPFPSFSFAPFSTSKLNIFDRQLKLKQRDRAAWLMPQNDPLLDTVADNLLDRLNVRMLAQSLLLFN